MASPGHREAILVPAYKFVNLGLAWREDGWGYRFHAVQLVEGDYLEYQVRPAIEYGGRLVLAGSRAVGDGCPQRSLFFLTKHLSPSRIHGLRP